MPARGPQKVEWKGRRVAPVLAERLDLVLVGINPGRYSAASGHHFAGPGNYFWRLLADSGLTLELLRPEEDKTLLQYGLGVTNIVDRPSPGSDDVRPEEFARGGRRLRARLARLKPLVACLLGKEVYRHFAGLRPSTRPKWGRQERQTVPGVVEFLAPNPSSRSTIAYPVRLALFRDLAALVTEKRDSAEGAGRGNGLD